MLSERVKSLVIANLAHPPLELGGDTRKLPLHVTIIPPFRHNRILTGRISHIIAEALEDVDSFTIHAEEEVMLEVNKRKERGEVKARKVGAQTLYTVHNKLISAIEDFNREGTDQYDEVSMDVQFAKRRFIPHATHTESQRLNRGEKRQINALYMLQKMQLSGSHPAWYVAAKYPLNKAK
jgi:hypothetical protein